jgi:hypothetical protein
MSDTSLQSKPEIVFVTSHGGGGSWLNNLIYHLETNDNSFPEVQRIFDFQKKSSVKFSHAFDYYTPDVCDLHDLGRYYKILFSSKAPFNLYLNESDKIQFNPVMYNKGNKPLPEQFDELTNSAKAWITYETIHKHYYTNIALEYKLIFCDPEQFVQDLFDILDSTNLKYFKNIEYCYASIEHYKKTCINPRLILGNLDNLYWLAWCHALVMIYKLPVQDSFNFLNFQHLQEVSDVLEPLQETCIDITKSLCFFWNET